jgi:FkbM family methyltransferase
MEMRMSISQLYRRTNLLKGYFAAEKNFSIGFGETLAKGVLKPRCTSIGPRYVSRIEEAGDFLQVHLRGIHSPLFWPRKLGTFDLYKAVTDCLHVEDWHHYEVPETTVRPGDVVLDCGAAEGIFALSVLDRASRVAIFEPSPDFSECLQRTFANAGGAIVVPAALGSSEGKAFLAGNSLYGFISMEQGIPINITTIDAWAARAKTRVDFIKGDLESHEFEVLKGASTIIRRDRPKIAFTVYHPGNDWKEMLTFLRELVPEYQFRIKGLSYNAGYPRPVMLHAWT